jgi:hypothetical protein
MKGKSVGTLLSGLDVSAVGKNLQFSLAHVYTLPSADTSSSSKKSIAASDATSLGTGLQGNYPNPFNPTTTISYQLASAGNVNLKIYDILGREIAMLVNGDKVAGAYTATFDGSRMASGIYFVRMSVKPNAGQATVKTMKMQLIK